MVRAVARQLGVALVDLEMLTAELVTAAGVAGSKALYVWTRAGEYPAFPAAREDNTHLSPRGAMDLSRLAAMELQRLDTPLATHIRLIR